MDIAWDNETIPNRDLYQVYRDIPYGDDPSDALRTLWVSIPRSGQDFATVVWFHGGGFVADKHECPAELYDGRHAVVEVRYRISPAAKAPAYHHDGAASLAWVLSHIADYGGNPGKVFTGGMSAGAYLAAIVGMDPRWLQPYGFAPRNLAGLLLISGQMSTHFQVKDDLAYPGNRYLPVIDELAPLSYLAVDLPPILMVTGDADQDIPARPAENAYMAASLRAMGHPHVECYHLSGHDHLGAFRSCGYLLTRFLDRVLAPSA